MLKQKQSVRRDLQFTIAALSLDAESLSLVWAELHTLTGFNDYANENQLAEALLTRWAEIDPDGAIDATSMMSSWMRQGAVGIVAKNWAKHSPDAALAWAKTITNSQFRQHAVGETLSQIGKSDRAGALALYMEALDDGSLTTERWNSSSFFSDWGREAPLQLPPRSSTNYPKGNSAKSSTLESRTTGLTAILKLRVSGPTIYLKGSSVTLR